MSTGRLIPCSRCQHSKLVSLEESMKSHDVIRFRCLDGQTLCDSVVIMHYLDETRPQNPLLPQDPLKRAKVREIVEIICSGIQPLQNRIVLEHLGKEASMAWAQHWISRGFRGLEGVLAASSGKYCVGDEISMADCCLVPQVFNARR